MHMLSPPFSYCMGTSFSYHREVCADADLLSKVGDIYVMVPKESLFKEMVPQKQTPVLLCT